MEQSAREHKSSVEDSLDEIGHAFGDLDVSALVAQVASLPQPVKERVFDPETVTSLNKMVTPDLVRKKSVTSHSSSKKKTKPNKAEVTLLSLSHAAREEDENEEETVIHAELDELERLSQLSERQSHDIRVLRKVLEDHDRILSKQAEDISLLLSKNTELQREVSSLKAGAQSPLEVSYGSRAGHFKEGDGADGATKSREVKASDLRAPSGQQASNAPEVRKPSSIKKKLDL